MTKPLMEAEVAGVVLEAVREAASLLEGLGHSLDPDLPELPDMTVGGLDPKQAFFNRYYAGEAVTVKQLGLVLGRELGPDDMEPLTWAMA